LVFAVDFAGIWAFKQVLPRLAAVAVAYLLDVAVHYCLNKWWVFSARKSFCHRELLRYGITVALCWISTVALVAAGLRLLTPNVFLAKALAVPPVTVLGFALMRWFVFR